MSGEREKTNKLRSMFFTYLFDMSWKLAISFLGPFFVALFVFKVNKTTLLLAIALGLVLSVFVIAHEVKKINKAVKNV